MGRRGRGGGNGAMVKGGEDFFVNRVYIKHVENCKRTRYYNLKSIELLSLSRLVLPLNSYTI